MAVRWEKAARAREPVMTALQARERKDALQRLGFDDYRQYLNSPLWHSIRLRVYARDKHRCVRCRKPAAHIHHTHYGYEALTGKRIEGMQAVCAGCHKCGHLHGKIIPVDIPPRKRRPALAVCPGCGCRKKKPTLCRKCRRQTEPESEIDCEFREMFSEAHAHRFLRLTPLK